MESRAIDKFEPAGRTLGIAAGDIVWAFGVSAVVLGLTPLLALYVLLIA